MLTLQGTLRRIPVYMLKWYKFQHGLSLIWPPAVCFGQAPLPGVPGAPGVPPVPGLTRVTRVSLSYSLYKVSTFLSGVRSRRWTALELRLVYIVF